MTCSAPDESVKDAQSNDEAALLARLQSQFGDFNVDSFLQGSSPTDGSPNDHHSGHDSCDDESSMEEPSPEELRAWQEAQFQKGRMHTEAKKIVEAASGDNVHKSALQRRREKKTAQQRTLIREYEASDEASEWEHVAPMPDLGGETSLFFPNIIDDDVNGQGGVELELAGGVHPLLEKLVQKGDPEVLGSKWTRLYSSSEGDGLSFRNLWDKLRGYDGPTLMLFGGIQSASRCLAGESGKSQMKRVSLGFFTTDSWIESTDFFGSDDDCFLFGLNHDENDVQIFRPQTRSKSAANFEGGVPSSSSSSKQTKRYMYCHPSSLSTANKQRRNAPGGTNGSLHGIGVGGTPSQPRLHITETLEECRALTYDNLFESGDLLIGKGDESLYYFDVDCLEVWGVGGEEWISDALEAQAKERSVYIASLEQARKVDKKQFLEDFQNGLVGNSVHASSANSTGLFGHRDLLELRDV